MNENKRVWEDDACWFPTYKFADVHVAIEEEETEVESS